MSTEKDRLIGSLDQPIAPPPGPGPPPYQEQPPPYAARPSPHRQQNPPYAARPPSPPPPQPPYAARPPHHRQQYPPYVAPPPPQVQPYSHYGSAPSHNMTAAQTQESKPRNYIILSLLTAICICPLCGCLALCFALQVDSAWAAGDREKARQSSKRARRLSLAGIFTIVITVVLLVMGYLMSIVFAYSLAS